MTPDPYAAPLAAAPPPDPERLAALDWLGIGVTALMTLRLVTFSLADWRGMFRDFGSVEDLPLLTRTVLLPWSTLVLATPGVASIAMAVRVRRRHAQRRRWIVAAVVSAFIGLAVFIAAIYLPIFTLADKIRAE